MKKKISMSAMFGIMFLAFNAQAEFSLPVPEGLNQGVKDIKQSASDAASTTKSTLDALSKPSAANAATAPVAGSTAMPPPAAVAKPAENPLAIKVNHDPSLLPVPSGANLNPAPPPSATSNATGEAAPAFPPVPAAISASEGAAPVEPKKDEAAAGNESPDATKFPATKKRAHSGKGGKRVAKSHVSPYHMLILPGKIYSKRYIRGNSHLPVAVYEQELNAQLFAAAEKNNVNAMRALLNFSHRNINARNVDGETPLMVAVEYNSLDVAHLLLGRHADTSVVDARGMSALDHARNSGRSHMARMIDVYGHGKPLASTPYITKAKVPVHEPAAPAQLAYYMPSAH